jgi:hypothetical protein
MNELAKLNKLLHHWMEHNDEHAETYKEWSEKAARLGKNDLSEILLKLCNETKRLNGLFQEAQKRLK